MGAPDISVVVPTYNRVHLIGATLDAILAQALVPAEVIVVDDGSTDGTHEKLAAEYPQIQVIRVTNGGDLAARNVGLRAATSRFVAFCDSDDLWRPEFLREIRQLWCLSSNLMTAFGNFQAVRDDIWEERTKFDDAPQAFWANLTTVGAGLGVFERPIIEQLLDYQPLFPSAMVVDRARFLQAGGWDEAVSRIVGTDFATTLRAAEQPIGIVKNAFVGIRKHSGNFSGDTVAMALGDAKILEHVLATRPSIKQYRTAIQDNIVHRRLVAMDIAFDRRDFAAARKIYALLPSYRGPFRRKVKHWITQTPDPIAHWLAACASWIST